MLDVPKHIDYFSVGKIATTVNNKFDASTLHEKPKLAAESQLVDDGTGERTVWRVEKFQLVPVPDTLQGVLFSGDCYVVKYTYLAGGTEKYLIYYWLVGCLMLLRLTIN
jgi:villin 1/advillin